MPVLDPLFESPQSLAKAEGPSLNKGLIHFYNCLESLAGVKSDFCFFEGSLLTHLLKNALGGNSFTAGVFCLSQGEGDSSLAALRVQRLLS